MPTAGQKRKAVSTTGGARRTPIGTQKYPPKAQSLANLRTPKAPNPPIEQPALATKTKPAASGPKQTVMTKSGIPIQVAKSEVEKAKSGGVIMTKSGIPIQISKGEAEKAQSGKTFTTASGVTIQISPSIGTPVKKESKPTVPSSGPKTLAKAGQAQVPQKPAAKAIAKPLGPKAVPQKPNSQVATSKASQSPTIQSPSVKKPIPAKPAGSQLNGAVPKKALPAKKPVSTGPPKIEAPKSAPKKLAS